MATSNDNGRGGYPTKSSLAAAREEVHSSQPPSEQHGQQVPQGQHQPQQQQAPGSSLQSPVSQPSTQQRQQAVQPAAQGSSGSSVPQGQAPKAGLPLPLPPQQHQQQQQQHAGQHARSLRSAQQRPPPPPQPQPQPQRKPPGVQPMQRPQPPGPRPPLQQQQKRPQGMTKLHALRQPLPLALLSTGSLAASALLVWGVASLIRGGRRRTAQSRTGADGVVLGPCAKVKPSQKCVPLADGSACVVRRAIPADNSCLFNAIGYVMHGSKTKASFLRSVVAREVSSDPAEYSEAFLGMSNAAYCNWIMQPFNWGGGIELAILSRHYGREIAAWNIESKKPSVFGEEQGYSRHVMIIYTGSHYDALAIAKHPKASESEDKVEFNPRTKTGKMAIAAARKLTELAHRSSKYYRPPVVLKLKCQSCKTVCKGQNEVEAHAKKTGHKKFDQMK